MHTPHRTPRMGCMIKRPGTCGAYAIRPYPTGRRGRTQKQKIPLRGWTDIAPFIITSNHYGNSVVKMYREVGAYCIRPYPTGRRGAVPIILTITPPDITKAGAALHCFRNVGPGLIASVRL